ncbi:spore morphogenesis/germination protein YwcE [Metabacillus litoralis]|uniref:spore morphogenesis/germination protein YwcE n=1 Tax=Metabacillus litoralis TaxID=152268 RepID=UPI001CFDABF2|nr:spore morphogenesis/germination protein YwcE [Metabacillus litoralis]
MDVFFAYLLFSSATPLFLWNENKKLAILQIPFIALMWVMFALYMTVDFGTLEYTLFGIIFALNVLAALGTGLYVYLSHFSKRVSDYIY